MRLPLLLVVLPVGFFPRPLFLPLSLFGAPSDEGKLSPLSTNTSSEDVAPLLVACPDPVGSGLFTTLMFCCRHRDPARVFELRTSTGSWLVPKTWLSALLDNLGAFGAVCLAGAAPLAARFLDEIDVDTGGVANKISEPNKVFEDGSINGAAWRSSGFW